MFFIIFWLFLLIFFVFDYNNMKECPLTLPGSRMHIGVGMDRHAARNYFSSPNVLSFAHTLFHYFFYFSVFLSLTFCISLSILRFLSVFQFLFYMNSLSFSISIYYAFSSWFVDCIFTFATVFCLFFRLVLHICSYKKQKRHFCS